MDAKILEAIKKNNERMDRLYKLPPPTVEQMRAQWKASAEFARNEPYLKKNKDSYVR